MSQEREEDANVQPLEYRRPAARATIWKLRGFQVFLIFIGLLAGAIVLAIAGYPAPLAIVCPAGIMTAYVWRFVAVKGKRRTEEEDEAHWEKWREEKREMVAVARQIYAHCPAGIWRMKDIFYRYRGDPTVFEEKLLKLSRDGTGTYQWFKRGDPPTRLAAIFLHKPGETDDTFWVQMTSPACETWQSVRFGFEVKRIDDKEQQLLLWLDSDNPMPVESIDYWPFTGEFLRELD